MTDIIKDLIKKDGKITVSSLKVAEYFEKEHFHVLRDIENLECSKEFSASNFGLTSYQDSFNRKQKAFEMTKDGFLLIAMGFTGKKATEWKEKFIEAFNLMEKVIREQIGGDLWKLARSEGKMVRIAETDYIKEFVDYAIGQGSKNAPKYYINLTKMENKALFFLEQAVPNVREALNIIQLGHIKTADFIVIKSLKEGMSKKMYYKDIYQFAKQRVEAFAAIIGTSRVGIEVREMIAVENTKEAAPCNVPTTN